MAITLEADDAAATAVIALVTADSDTLSAVALNNATQTTPGTYDSANYLIGGVKRRGDPQGTLNFPRIEVDIQGTNERDSFGRARFEGVARIHILTNRNTPTGFSGQSGIAMRARTVLNRATPTTAGGWTFNLTRRIRGFQGPPSTTEQQYIVEYAISGTGGSGNF